MNKKFYGSSRRRVFYQSSVPRLMPLHSQWLGFGEQHKEVFLVFAKVKGESATKDLSKRVLEKILLFPELARNSNAFLLYMLSVVFLRL